MTAGTTTTESIGCLPMNLGYGGHEHGQRCDGALQRKDIEVFVTGGNLRGTWFSLVGEIAIQSISKVFIDTLFIGMNGIDQKSGLTCFNSDEAELNKVMV
jgi:DeoR family transcriptional regulator of aga operon